MLLIMQIPKLLRTTIGCAIVFITFFCGISRTDVSKEKYLALGRAPQFESVGSILHAADKKPDGSCVLIDDRHVLTAAHVVTESDIKPDTVDDNGKQVIFYQSTNERAGKPRDYLVEFKGETYRCISLKIHPAYLDTASQGACDIAMLELDRPVKGVTPAALNTGFDELHAEATGVGYGVSGPAYPADSVLSMGEKIGGMNMIDTIEGHPLNGKGTLLVADFDSPINPELSAMGDVKPLPLEYGTGGGDSGGGLFRKSKGSWELIGICSGTGNEVERLIKYGYYGEIMRWTRVSVFLDWIKQAKK